MRRALLSLLLLSPLASAKRPPLFGHLPYAEASARSLSDAGTYRNAGRTVRLRKETSEAFKQMVAAALPEGVRLIPISGFRTTAYQRGLWDSAIQRRGSAAAAAKWVAPPGHSEHHTGWALDLGDADAPTTDVDPTFEKTKAFAWMQANASRFHFELSFPKDNLQGVSYEPWHWRFIGSDEARLLFHPEN